MHSFISMDYKFSKDLYQLFVLSEKRMMEEKMSRVKGKRQEKEHTPE